MRARCVVISRRAAGILFAALCVSLPARQAGAAGAANVKIGVVNVSEVFARYRKAEELQKKNTEAFAARQQDLLKRQQELVRKAAALQGQTGDEQNPANYKGVKDLERAKFLLEQDYQEFQHDLKVAQDRFRRYIREEIAAACRRIGSSEGYDLILKIQEADPDAAGDRARIEMFESNAVLYASPSVDITPRVLSFLEDAYRRGVKLVPDDGLGLLPAEGGNG